MGMLHLRENYFFNINEKFHKCFQKAKVFRKDSLFDKNLEALEDIIG